MAATLVKVAALAGHLWWWSLSVKSREEVEGIKKGCLIFITNGDYDINHELVLEYANQFHWKALQIASPSSREHMQAYSHGLRAVSLAKTLAVKQPRTADHLLEFYTNLYAEEMWRRRIPPFLLLEAFCGNHEIQSLISWKIESNIHDRIFISKDELVDWTKQTAMKANTYFIVNRYQKSRTSDCRPAQKIYNVVAKIKKNKMKGRNMVEEVLCLSEGRGYTVLYRKREESNASTYRWVLQQIKHIYVSSAMSYRNSSILNDDNNRAESEHSVVKLWLSTCYGDLDTVFLNINSLIKGQIAEIKTSLEISKLKEKYGVKSNPILKNISNNINHLTLKKIWLEIKRAGEISDDQQSKCGHYLRKLQSLLCACELVSRYVHALLLQAEDIYIFWRKLEIGVDISNVHGRDMDFEMCNLTSMLEEISTGPISKVREVHRLTKGSGPISRGRGRLRGRGRPPRSGRVTYTRWMPVAFTACAMVISSRYRGQWMGRSLL
ncbi:hypothetical protein M9H77_08001 [Catharanthus roseus]|uniref:Uncharacterized protein n=1 Tax=Catharanthus roseus TaxID=4058 RepID=A0ACC0BWV7_CATRO|nr:hypothetical protein M9H77_08001 [Catharanthus roseus]